MIIDDLDISGFAGSPLETNSPLVIYSNAVLAASFALEFFKPLARHGLQISQILCLIQIQELAARRALNVFWQSLREPAVEDLLRFSGRKGYDHGTIISSRDNSVKSLRFSKYVAPELRGRPSPKPRGIGKRILRIRTCAEAIPSENWDLHN